MMLDNGVAQISRSRTVPASPRQVWDVLADFGAISSWAANVDHSCLLEHGSGAADVGTSRRLQVGRDALVERITEYTPPDVLGYDIEGLPRRVRRASNRWSLAGLGTSTSVTLTSTVQIGSTPLARIAEHAMCRFLARQSDTLLDGLTTRLEGLR